MLEKHLTAAGLAIAVASAGRAHRRLLKGHLMNYPTIGAEAGALEISETDGIAAAV
jgi:hypothetical protein